MKRSITINDSQLEYTLRRSYIAKRLRFTIHKSGNLLVTAPVKIDERTIERHMLSKSSWIIQNMKYIKDLGKNAVVDSTKTNHMKIKAGEIIKNKVERLNRNLQLKYKTISIKDQKTRWGSCSKDGALNFNWRIVLLPNRLQEYVIIHELCHLRESNHSAKFWSLIEKHVPAYKKHVTELKEMGLLLE